MASTETAEKTEAEETNGGNGSSGGHDTRKAAVRAAAIAAASGATALAAKKAFSGRGSSSGDDGESKPARKSDDGSVLTSVLTSSWDSARGSVVPMLEDAATHAGEYVAKNAPEIVSETLVPKFIRGFERGRKSSSDDDE